MSNAPSKPVSFSRPKVGYFSNRPRMLIKYIKSVLWRVAKRMSYVEEAWCLKGKGTSKVGALSRMCTGIVTDFCELINYLINK